MARLSLQTILLYLLVFLIPANAQSCNTNQNPYCRGNSKLEALCCPYPSICYWSNRNGEPACCPAGQDCRLNGGPGPTVYQTPSQQSFVIQTLSTSYPTTYTVYSSTSPPLQPWSSVSTAVVIITSTDNYVQSATSAVGGAYTTVTSFVGGAFTTITSAVGGAFSTVSQVFNGGSTSHTSNIPSGVLLTIFTTLGGIILGAVLL